MDAAGEAVKHIPDDILRIAKAVNSSAEAREIVMAQKIKLMADYQCWPLWDLQEPDNVHPVELPLSHETIERLLRWSEAYDAILNWDDPATSGFESQEAAAAFEQEGIRLWLQLRQELTPDYEVFYFSEGQHRLFSRLNELPLQNITDAQPSQYL